MTDDRSVKMLLSQSRDLDLLDAQLLLAHVLGTTRVALYSHDDRMLTDVEFEQWQFLLNERRRGVPIAYLLGEKECYGMMFYVSPDVLIPRPDTELLIELVLSVGKAGSANILDLATGPGVIACALGAHRPEWYIVATDICEKTLAIAERNIARHGLKNVSTRISDVYEAIPETFDVIVSNPPYIAPNDLHLAGEIRFEPHHALVADEAGYAILRRLIEGACAHLHPGGYLFLEHGFEQAAGVRTLLTAAGFDDVKTVKDLSGNDRVTYAVKPALPVVS